MSREPGDWIAPADTTKLKCPDCGHWFASKGAHRCATCEAKRQSQRKALDSPGPFDPFVASSGRPMTARATRFSR